ncbi:MAG: tyrosine phosphatase family protein [Rhizomicrobium sp.]
MSAIFVTPLSQVEQTIRRYRPSHMMTLLSPGHMIETPQGIDAARHLKLGLNDVVSTDLAEDPPNSAHVDRLIEFGRDWDARSPMLIHCWAGISRSMAAAYILLCDRFGPFREKEIAMAMRARAPHAYPNPLLVELADKALCRNGRMVIGAESIGRGTIVAEGEIVELPLSADEL